MAFLLTRDEFKKQVEEQAKVLLVMPANAKVCPLCLVLYRPDLKSGQFGSCYCDYESPMFEG